MFWGPSKALLCAAAALCATAASANILVVRSSGPSAGAYPPGRSLPDSTRITLRQGDTLVLLGGRGTRQLTGPGTFTAGGAAQGATRSQMASNAAAGRARLGASRQDPDGARVPTFWHADVSQSSNVCVTNPEHVLLWRPAASQAVTLTIAPASGGEARTVAWPAGQAELPWPAGVPLVNDAQYRVSISGVPVPARLRFRVLPSVPSGLEAIAVAFIENECEAQLNELIAISVPPEPAE